MCQPGSHSVARLLYGALVLPTLPPIPMQHASHLPQRYLPTITNAQRLPFGQLACYVQLRVLNSQLVNR